MSNRMRAARARGLIAISVAAVATLIAVVPASGRGAAYESGDVIVADSVNNAIKAVDPVSGAASTVSSGGNFVFPADVTFDEDGDILVVDRDAFGGRGGIIRIDSATATQTPVSSNAISEAAGGKELFRHPIALDRKGGSLFVADYAPPRKIIKVNVATGKQALISKDDEMNSPFGIVADGVDKPLVSDAGAFRNGGVLKINPDTGKQIEVSKNGKFKYPQMLTLFGSNSALVTDTDSFEAEGAIFRVNLRTGAQKTIARGGPINNPSGIALLDDDTAVVADYTTPFPKGGVYRVDLETGDQTPLNTTDLYNPIGIRIAP